MKKLKDQRGFALLESAFSLVTTLSILSVLLSTLYLSLGKIWINHLAYEVVLCQMSIGASKDCSENFLKKASVFLMGAVSIQYLKGSSSSGEVKGLWLPYRKVEIKFEHQLPRAEIKPKKSEFGRNQFRNFLANPDWSDNQ